MSALLSRRALIGAGLSLPLLAVSGCATGVGGFGFEEAIRRLLTISSQRAFTSLLQDNGFFEDDLARVSLPPQLGGAAASGVAAALLRSPLVQNQLLRIVNDAAAEAAEAAAPVVYDSIRTMTIADALSIVRGGPTAATDYLQGRMGDAIVNTLFPGVGQALRVVSNPVLGQALQAASGIDFLGLQRDVSAKASAGIYRAIGREEAAIRANPRAVNDPLLTGVFGVLR